MNDDSGMTVAQRLAGVIQVRSDATLADNVVHAAKRCIIDWTCAALAGSTQKQALALERALADELGHGSSQTLSGHRASMRTAALINGLASHIVEFDDIYAPGTYHPGSPTIAAALSAATGLNRSGPELIRAVVAGYEVSNRVARAMGTDHYRYWHTTGTAGAIGATAAVSSLNGLTHRQTANALATATTMASGLQNAFRGESEIKPLHAGHAADAGFVAAGLAREGVIAAADMFEGSAGFGNAMCGAVAKAATNTGTNKAASAGACKATGANDLSPTEADLANRANRTSWVEAIGDINENTIERTTIKIHGCCGHIFPALDGALALQAKHRFATNEIARIVVGAYSATVNVTGNMLADTPASAKFCLPFIVASALVHGSIGLDAYSAERLHDPVVLALMKKITVQEDDAIEARFPSQRAANVLITLNNGTQLHRLQPHRVGDPDLPLSDDQLNQKFIALTDGVLSASQAGALLNDLWVLDAKPALDFYYRR